MVPNFFFLFLSTVSLGFALLLCIDLYLNDAMISYFFLCLFGLAVEAAFST